VPGPSKIGFALVSVCLGACEGRLLPWPVATGHGLYVVQMLQLGWSCQQVGQRRPSGVGNICAYCVLVLPARAAGCKAKVEQPPRLGQALQCFLEEMDKLSRSRAVGTV